MLRWASALHMSIVRKLHLSAPFSSFVASASSELKYMQEEIKTRRVIIHPNEEFISINRCAEFHLHSLTFRHRMPKKFPSDYWQLNGWSNDKRLLIWNRMLFERYSTSSFSSWHYTSGLARTMYRFRAQSLLSYQSPCRIAMNAHQTVSQRIINHKAQTHSQNSYRIYLHIMAEMSKEIQLYTRKRAWFLIFCFANSFYTIVQFDIYMPTKRILMQLTVGASLPLQINKRPNTCTSSMHTCVY